MKCEKGKRLQLEGRDEIMRRKPGADERSTANIGRKREKENGTLESKVVKIAVMVCYKSFEGNKHNEKK